MEVGILWPLTSAATSPPLITGVAGGTVAVGVAARAGNVAVGLAALLVAFGWGAKNAIAWVRKNYCESAIESNSQEDYVYEMLEQRQKESKK